MPITRQPYFLPTQITGCSLWLDAADTSADSMILSGSNVSTWKDKSGTGNNATANTGTVTTNSTKINGLNTIRFNTSSFLNIASFTMTANISVFAVLRGVGTQGSGNAGYFFLGNGAQPSFFVYTLQPQFGNLSGPYSAWVASTGETNWYMPSSDFFLNNPGFIYTDNSSSFVNGSQLTFNPNRASVPNAVSAGAYSIQVGGRVQADSLAFDFAECIFFNRTITSTERQRIEGYLAQKWGLTSSLPTGHPGLDKIIHRNLQTTFTKKQYFTAFSPQQISGCILWLDAADASSVTTSGTTVTAIRDKSARATVLTSPAGFTYPNNTFNGSYPSFYNTSASGGRLGYNSSFSLGSQNTVFIVGQLTSPSVGNQFFDFIDGYASSSRFFLFSSPNNLNNYVYGTNGSSSGQVNGAVTTAQMTSPFFWSVAFDTSTTISSTLQYVNGTQLVQSPSTLGAAISSYTGIIIGQRFTQSSESVVGHICEFIIFNNVLTATQRQQVESYLAQKWGLVSSLPTTGHIHNTFPAGSPTAIQPYVPSIRPALVFAAVPTYILKYTYTGSNQSFVVPSGVTSVTVYMWGAGGGAGLGGNGGAGCYVQGVLTVVPGETLTIIVGQGGGNKARALGKSYGGGGAGGGPDGGRSDIPSSQGGGRSAIVRSSTDLVTAAAGGGGRGGRGGRGRLVTGENGTGQATGGTQSAGGTNNGGLYTGGDANQDNSAAGGSGYYGGGGGGQDQAGGGGSCLTSNLSLIAGQSTFGTESSDGSAAPQTSSTYYNSDVGFGATSAYGYNYGSGGNGLVVIGISSKTAIASVSYSRLILSAWFGSVAYRYGLDVTTVVNNAFGGNPSNTITLNVATLTNPQIGTTKYTYIVYMFNGIQKFSSPYAEGTVLTFSSLT